MSNFLNKLYGQRSLPDHSAADKLNHIPLKPSPEIVLCRDINGNPTAIYGESIWDFTPYNLLPGRSAIINFQTLFGEEHDDGLLVEEIKRILLFLMYGGNDTEISVRTLLGYFKTLKTMARFCKIYQPNIFVGAISIEILITNRTFLKKYVDERINRKNFRWQIKTFLSHAKRFPRGAFKQPIVDFKDLSIELQRWNQVSVIPSRIYFNLMEQMSYEIDHIYANMQGLDLFIASFREPGFGTSKKYQKKKFKTNDEDILLSFEHAVSKFQLNALFVGAYTATSKKNLMRVLTRMQFLIKNVIHLFTGMRDQEVARLQLGCVNIREVSSALTNDKGDVREHGKSINIISTTSKFSKGLRSESWIAPIEVVKAIEIAETICKGLAAAVGITPTDHGTYLFLSSNVLHVRKSGKVAMPYFSKIKSPVPLTEDLRITDKDFKELCLSDPDRDFSADPKFSIGALWSLTSHQYRRSLAYYASSSGFVSQLSLKKQFKHTCLLMTQYYGNNYRNFKSVFGYFDEELNESVLPGTHIAYEFQLGMSEEIVDQIMDLYRQENTSYFGGAGVSLEREKRQFAEEAINIVELRTLTARAVKFGERSYRPTLLGGCAKLGPCDNLMLGDVTACLSCESSVLERQKIIMTKSLLEDEASRYLISSGEFQICQSELQLLERALHKTQDREVSS